jgi:hypothetical protein
MRRSTIPPPFGPRIRTLGISVLFAVAGQCTIRRFHGPNLAGTRPAPVGIRCAAPPKQSLSNGPTTGLVKITGPNLLDQIFSVSDVESSSLAGYFRLNRSNLCTHP